MTSQPDPAATDSTAIDEDGIGARQELPSDYRATAGPSPASGGNGGAASGGGPGAARAPDSDAAPDPYLIDPDLITVAEEISHEDPGADDLTDEPQTGGHGQMADLGQHWHDIQALFVDDPRGSVELAAAAADAAVSTLVETLHQRQAALAPSGSAPAESGDTEQLREALRSYRMFCQSLTDVGQRLAQPAGMAQ